MTTNTTKQNRLIHEASPYLLQHAHNPVDWYPWGQEAFDKAMKEDKPVFLSIGYSTCHWCHVMAHESFEDKDVANVLNSGFVSVKVDREQRPDIDEVYMSVCQAMTGSGGWPLSIFMGADKRPFFAGTYFPRDTAFGRIGFIELCANVLRVWKTDRQSLLENSSRIIEHLTAQPAAGSAAEDADAVIDSGYRHLEAGFDKEHGGFSHAPKFPTPHNILFLLKYSTAKNEPKALRMAELTLESMFRGGIYDHIGGGFSRYSTDREWLVPHFEKMLYDNAMLLLAYSEAYTATKKDKYRAVIDGIAGYVLRDMRSQSGGFYSAEDADSEGVEGKFYVFGYDELKKNFSDEDMQILEKSFGVTKQGNFEGKNIINKIGLSLEETQEQQDVIKKLYDMRQKRIRPFKDTKISASWNGLMIEALCRAGIATSNQSYIDSAKNAAEFIIDHMMFGEELYGIYKEGSSPTGAFLADYANFANALIALYSATLDLRYLIRALRLAKQMISQFFDENENSFYMSGKNGEELFFRAKDEYDGAMPSGSSCAVKCLHSLSELTGDDGFTQLLKRAVKSFCVTAGQMPGAYIHFLSTLLSMSTGHSQVVIAADKDSEKANNAYERLLKEHLPFTTLIRYDGSGRAKQAFPLLSAYETSSAFTAYVCENFACNKPIDSPDDLFSLLGVSL